MFAKYLYFRAAAVLGLCKLIHISLVWYLPSLHATNDSLCERRCPIQFTKTALLIFNSGGQIKLKHNFFNGSKSVHYLPMSDTHWWLVDLNVSQSVQSCWQLAKAVISCQLIQLVNALDSWQKLLTLLTAATQRHKSALTDLDVSNFDSLCMLTVSTLIRKTIFLFCFFLILFLWPFELNELACKLLCNGPWKHKVISFPLCLFNNQNIAKNICKFVLRFLRITFSSNFGTNAIF